MKEDSPLQKTSQDKS